MAPKHRQRPNHNKIVRPNHNKIVRRTSHGSIDSSINEEHGNESNLYILSNTLYISTRKGKPSRLKLKPYQRRTWMSGQRTTATREGSPTLEIEYEPVPASLCLGQPRQGKNKAKWAKWGVNNEVPTWFGNGDWRVSSMNWSTSVRPARLQAGILGKKQPNRREIETRKTETYHALDMGKGDSGRGSSTENQSWPSYQRTPSCSQRHSRLYLSPLLSRLSPF